MSFPDWQRSMYTLSYVNVRRETVSKDAETSHKGTPDLRFLPRHFFLWPVPMCMFSLQHNCNSNWNPLLGSVTYPKAVGTFGLEITWLAVKQSSFLLSQVMLKFHSQLKMGDPKIVVHSTLTASRVEEQGCLVKSPFPSRWRIHPNL